MPIFIEYKFLLNKIPAQDEDFVFQKSEIIQQAFIVEEEEVNEIISKYFTE